MVFLLQADVTLDDRMPSDEQEDPTFLANQWDNRLVRMPMPRVPQESDEAGNAGASSSGSGARPPVSG